MLIVFFFDQALREILSCLCQSVCVCGIYQRPGLQKTELQRLFAFREAICIKAIYAISGLHKSASVCGDKNKYSVISVRSVRD
jgi:hypothetical protein